MSLDNRYFKYGCPALMQDGRFITNYMESRIFEQYIRNVNKIGSAQEFKRFLQTNGDTIMNRERAYQQQVNTCGVQGKCVPLSGMPGSCSLYPNVAYGSSCGCANSNKQ
jgi:hypothetical protein